MAYVDGLGLVEERVGILNLFDENNLTETGGGQYKAACPDCGQQGGRTDGFIIFPEDNRWYCHSSGKHGGILELAALKYKIINCLDCLETGERRRVLEGELFKDTLDTLKEEVSEEVYNGLLAVVKIKRRIELPNDGKLISTFARELSDRTKDENIFFYRPDLKHIVEIFKFKDVNGDYEYKGFSELSDKRFITLMERYFNPYSLIHLKNAPDLKITKSIPQNIVKIILESDEFRDTMPVIKRIFDVPIPIIHDGVLTFPKIGYDERFGSWLSHNSPYIEFPEMKLKEAKEILNKMYDGFCFKSEQDRTNSIAALLTPFLKGLFSSFSTRPPVFFYMANRERSGKDYNAGITGLVYEGSATEQPPLSSNDRNSNSNEEFRKKIMSVMIQGRRRFHSSNNKGLINNAVLESITTAETYSDRLLGKNVISTLDNELDFSLSGNIGTTLTPDMANRSIYINLFLDIEDANKREFDNPNLHGWVLENRNTILSALYCLIRNWVDKKCPDGSIPFASYPQWSKICGGIMEAAELGNPCVRSDEGFGVSLDTETEDMKVLFEMCFEFKPDVWMNKQDIKDIILNSQEETFSYMDWDKKSHQIQFGKKLDRFVGRILSDIRFVVKNNNVRAARREYKFVKEKASFIRKNKDEEKSQRKNGNVGNNGNVLPRGNLYTQSYREKGVGNLLPTLPTLPNPKINKKKEKSDREVQFFDAEECKDIKPKHTKQQVLDFIKKKPKTTSEQLYEKFGTGALKFRNELKQEGLI